MKEQQLYKQIIDYLNSCGFFVWRASVGRRGKYRHGKPGQGDIIGVTPNGKHIEIECKKPEGKLSAVQIEHKGEVEKRKGLYLVVDSFKEIIDLITFRPDVFLY